MKQVKKTKTDPPQGLLLSIIIPFYNEEKTLDGVVSDVIKQKLPGWKKEIILVNDGSNDTSLQKAKKHTGKTILISSAFNQGMGNALKSGLKHATGDVILFQDADCEYNPNDIYSLLQPFKDLNTQVVYGSRYKKSTKRGYYSYYIACRFFTRLINLFYKSDLTDAFTGYKLFRRNVLQKIQSPCDDFAFNVDITTKILKKGYSIYEVPINYSPRSFAQGKKISPWIGLKDLWIIIKNVLFASSS